MLFAKFLDDLELICGGYDLTDRKWTLRDGNLSPSNIVSARGAMVVDGIAVCEQLISTTS